MPELVPAKKLSQILFGHESSLTTRWTIMSFEIDPPEPFREKEIFDRMYPDANAGLIGKELGRLVKADVIVPMPELGTHPSKYYRRVESALWPFIAELAQRTIEFSSVEDPQT